LAKRRSAGAFLTEARKAVMCRLNASLPKTTEPIVLPFRRVTPLTLFGSRASRSGAACPFLGAGLRLAATDEGEADKREADNWEPGDPAMLA
jgi:hypothetical protein